jgi:TatD DNase family protein
VLNVFPDEKVKLAHTVYFSVGLHPWYVHEKTWQQMIGKIKSLALEETVVAIGEAGLDKAIKNPYPLQTRIFEEQLALAESLMKPLILHCVRSYSEMLAYRKKANQSLPWIFHWFNSDEQTASELIRKNCYLSFGHMLFNEQSKAFRVFKTIPLDQVFFETDDSGFTIQQVYERAAWIRNIQVEDLKAQIASNFKTCFKLSL